LEIEAMITYETIKDTGVTKLIKVRLDGKLVGAIARTIAGKFKYIPNGQKVGGELFNTIEEVKKSIEPA